MDKKKIILLHHVSDQGGGTKSLIDVALMLRDKYDVVLCLPKGSDTTIGFAAEYGISCHELRTPVPTCNVFSGGPSILSRNFLKGIFRFSRINDLVGELMSLKPDVLILNSLVTSLIAKRIPSTVVVICFIRETLVQSPLMRLFRQTFEKRIDGVAYIAEHEKRVFNIKKPYQAVLPDTVEPKSISLVSKEEARNICGLKQDLYYVLYMGGSAKLKGFDTILEAAIHTDDNVCVVILGNISLGRFTLKNVLLHLYNPGYVRYLLRVRKFMALLRDDPRVLFLGYRSDISTLMCSCDVIAFPSSEPHQPRPCIEAGVYGKPVILSDFEATREFFVDGYNALVFKPNNGKELAAKIIMLIQDEELADRLGDHNRLMSKEKHDYETIQKDTLTFIEDTISSKMKASHEQG